MEQQLKMIEVFKTNVQQSTDAVRLVQVLKQHFPSSRINFDLDDCDRILRVEGEDVDIEQIMGLVKGNGFRCSVLD
jgi:hypothetical protein